MLRCVEHLARLQNFREACKAKAAEIKQLAGMDVAPLWATMVDIKGPEVCTALLRDGKSIMLEKDQKIVIEAVGDKYTTFKGYKTSEETRIGLSYAGLCSSVAVGHQILLDNGAVTIVVDEILSSNQLRGTVQNSKELGEMVNCNLPGAKLKLPVLTDKDVRDLEEFVCKHKVDFVAAPLVQSFTDVKSVRAVLDSAGGFETKIIAKIENQEGLNNYDEILREADGVMVARGSLGVLLLYLSSVNLIVCFLAARVLKMPVPGLSTFRRACRSWGPCVTNFAAKTGTTIAYINI
jgi:pyruvate kinase